MSDSRKMASTAPRRTRLALALAVIFASATLEADPAGADPQRLIASDTVVAARQYAFRLAQSNARNPRRGATPAPRNPTGNVLPVTSCLDDGSAGTLRSVIGTAGEGDTVDLSQLTCGIVTLTQGPIDMSVLGPHHVDDLTIVGPGAVPAKRIDGNYDRIFVHGNNEVGVGTLSIRDLWIGSGVDHTGLPACIDSSGNVDLTRVIIEYCRTSGGTEKSFAAAVHAHDLSLTDSIIDHSHNWPTGDTVALGGGVYVSGNLTLVDSTISGNSAHAETFGDYLYNVTAGGGAFVVGDLSMTRSTVQFNIVTTSDRFHGLGGGLFVRGNANIVDSTVFSNVASIGGGVYKIEAMPYGEPYATTLSVTNSTFTENTAYYLGGAIGTRRPAVISNSTIAVNIAIGGVGGLWAAAGFAPSIELQSSIVSGNFNESGSFFTDIGSHQPLDVVGANNLIGEVGFNVTLPPSVRSDDPMLDRLADNGGPTKTMAILPGSPAIDAGNNVANLAFDQRGEGYQRLSGTAPDIGAFEADDGLFSNGFE